MRPIRLAALAALLLALPAAGHVGDFSEGKSFAAAPYSGTLLPADDYIYDNRPAGLRVLLVETVGSAFKPPGPSTAIAWSATRGGLAMNGTFVATTVDGQWDSPATFPAAGEWNVTLAIKGTAGNRTISVPMMVYKQLGYRIKPTNPELDPFLEETTTLGFRQVWYDVALQPGMPAVQDLTMRIERWDDLHKVMLSSQEIQMQMVEGAWETDHEFQELGMFHMSFASRSGGFGFDEMPLQHVYVLERPPQETDWLRLGLFAVIMSGSVALAAYGWHLYRRRDRGED